LVENRHRASGSVVALSKELDERLSCIGNGSRQLDWLRRYTGVDPLVAQSRGRRWSWPTHQMIRDFRFPCRESVQGEIRPGSSPEVVEVLAAAPDDPGLLCHEAELVVAQQRCFGEVSRRDNHPAVTEQVELGV